MEKMCVYFLTTKTAAIRTGFLSSAAVKKFDGNNRERERENINGEERKRRDLNLRISSTQKLNMKHHSLKKKLFFIFFKNQNVDKDKQA